MQASKKETRLPHDWNDEGICRYCGFDGAEDWWLNNNLRMEIGNDEFSYRKDMGEFDAGRFCPKRTPRKS